MAGRDLMTLIMFTLMVSLQPMKPVHSYYISNPLGSARHLLFKSIGRFEQEGLGCGAVCKSDLAVR